MREARSSSPRRDAIPLTNAFNGVRVFCVSGHAGPEHGARRILQWLASHPRCEVRDVVVTQSDRRASIAITLFYWEEAHVAKA